MADLGDLAVELEAEHLARSLAAARAAVPVGVAGECDNCGDESPRLVGGWCARCRDGRIRVAARVPGRVPPPVAEPAPRMIATAPVAEPTIMATPLAVPAPTQGRNWIMAHAGGDRKRAITFTATGAVLDEIEAGVEAHGSLGASALALIAARAEEDDELADAPAPGALALEAVHVDALLAELRLRVERAALGEAERMEAALEAAVARAEARVAQMRAVLG